MTQEEQKSECPSRISLITRLFQDLDPFAEPESDSFTESSDMASRSQYTSPNEVEQMMKSMQEQIAQLQDQLKQENENSNSSPVTTRTYKPQKPEAFHGRRNESVDVWIFKMEEYFRLCKLTDPKEQTDYGASFFKDNAAVWWRNRRQGNTPMPEWIDVKKALVAQFKPVNSNKIARDRLASLRQTKSVQSYTYAFQSTILEIEDISESEKLDRYVRGLKERIRQEHWSKKLSPRCSP